jgi:4-aminobutyrate aminotransferase-like enzyme
MPPDDFFPKLSKFCDDRKILLMADEVLTSWGRTGKWLAMEHWGVVPDVVTIGKGFGNGFPVTCVAVREPFKESFESISASSATAAIPWPAQPRSFPPRSSRRKICSSTPRTSATSPSSAWSA